jgi:hypothetical protein
MRSNNHHHYDDEGEEEEEQRTDLSTNAELLKEILENQKNATPTNIEKCLRLFMLDEPTFITQPNALTDSPPLYVQPCNCAGSIQPLQMRPKYVQQPGVMGMMGGAVIKTPWRSGNELLLRSWDLG